ncbi:hypothetical protein F4813DRAFT_349946 [Daldinia decipiens]|uniref:uncharacterized protein n=1 Tax=Daldinia decipiens TaxID=326647 RepID=UPI0020C4C6E6|nr:uncharacterized protein F4813DRAFT_349946 [Daldinia decipiens]KAI1660429.1 hypothetical protein F4813DRAFT_349946 [Daldinia decipiens]
MQHSSPHINSASGDSHIPSYMDNAKSLSSVMARANESPRRAAELSSRSRLAEDLEPLLGYPDEHHSPSSDENPAAEPLRKRPYVGGLAIIVLCRLFNTIFAACTIGKAINVIGDGWNYWINIFLFGICLVIPVWNIFALTTSIVSYPFCSIFGRKRGESVSGFRDRLRIRFACNDAVLGLITLGLLAIACHAISSHWGERFVGLRPPIIAMVSVLVGAEFFTAMMQLQR